MNMIEKYRLNPKVTDKQLNEFGFKQGRFKSYVYKKMLQLVIYIDTDDNWWTYQVHDVNVGTLYVPYYNKRYGKNELIEKIDKKIKNTIDQMLEKNILTRQGQGN